MPAKVSYLGLRVKHSRRIFGSDLGGGVRYAREMGIKHTIAKNIQTLLTAAQKGKISGPGTPADFSFETHGVSRSTVYRLLDPENPLYAAPTTDKLEAIAGAYELPAWALLTDELDPEDRPVIGTEAQLELRAVELMQDMVDERRRTQEAAAAIPRGAHPIAPGTVEARIQGRASNYSASQAPKGRK